MSHIDVSVSYGFGGDNRYHEPGPIPQNIQLALYKYDLYTELKKKIFKEISKGHIHVKAVHMPLDFLRQEPSLMFDMIKEIRDEVGAFKFIVHPNKGIKKFLALFLDEDIWDVQLCIENFQWRKRKELRNPIKIIEYMWYLRSSALLANTPGNLIKMCLDTSHTDDVWFDYQMLSYILPYTSVIHLSNRQGRNQHLPFNTSNGDLNLIGFVKNLKRLHKWSGDIVLEYMPEYRHKLTRNCEYIKQLLYGSAKKYNKSGEK